MKKKVKSAAALMLAGIMMLGIYGCGSADSQAKATTETPVQEKTTAAASASSAESTVKAETAAESTSTSAASTESVQASSTEVQSSETATASAQGVSGSELAFSRDYKVYQVYYLFNTDDKTVKFLSTEDGKVVDGTYTGDIKTGAELDFTSADYKEQFKMAGKEGDMAVVTDRHDLESFVMVAEPSDVEAVFNKQ